MKNKNQHLNSLKASIWSPVQFFVIKKSESAEFRHHHILKRSLLIFIKFIVPLIGIVLFAIYQHGIDAHVYHMAGHSLFSGGRTDLYAPDFGDGPTSGYLYPPFFLFLVYPFTFLAYDWAEHLWLLINVIAVSLTIIAVKRGFKDTVGDFKRLNLILFLSILICAKPFFILIKYLNVHLFILCLIFGAFYLLLKQHKSIAALLMALAITIKVFPILTLPYFALKKQWFFLSATVVLTIVFNLLPAFYFGTELNFKLLNDWYNHVMVNNEFHELNGPINLSLKGQIRRYLVKIDYQQRIQDRNYQNVNFVSISENQADQIWKIAILFITGGTIFVIWFSSRMRNKIEFLSSKFDSFAYYEFGLIICLSLIIAPRSNLIYFVALFFSLIPFLHTLFCQKSRFNMIIFAVVLILNIVLPIIPGGQTQRLFLVLGTDFYLAIIIWLALIYNLVKESLNQRKNSLKLEDETLLSSIKIVLDTKG